MNLKFLYSIFILLYFCSACKTTSYTVYDVEMKKKKINPKDSNKVVILSNYVACLDCLPNLVQECEQNKEIIIVSIVSKNKIAIQLAHKKIQNIINNDNVQLFYQFHNKKDPYEYANNNKLFKDYKHQKSPIVINTTKQ